MFDEALFIFPKVLSAIPILLITSLSLLPSLSISHPNYLYLPTCCTTLKFNLIFTIRPSLLSVSPITSVSHGPTLISILFRHRFCSKHSPTHVASPRCLQSVHYRPLTLYYLHLLLQPSLPQGPQAQIKRIW